MYTINQLVYHRISEDQGTELIVARNSLSIHLLKFVSFRTDELTATFAGKDAYMHGDHLSKNH